jgi:hypothetical protein
VAWKGRTGRLAALLRDTAYEVVLALVSVTAGWQMLLNPHTLTSPLSPLAPTWEVVGFAVGLMLGGLLTVVGLVLTGASTDRVRRVIARRLEEFGQITLAGMFMAPAITAFGLGGRGFIAGMFDLGLSMAAISRVREMRAAFATATPPEVL